MVIYNITPAMLESYNSTKVIVRARAQSELAGAVQRTAADRLLRLELHSFDGDPHELTKIDESIPLDVVFKSSEARDLWLGRHHKVLKGRSVRLCIPVEPGFSRAARTAVSKGFAVRLELTQPDAILTKELVKVLDYYLHDPNVARPIEFFHSLLEAFFRKSPVSIWRIQEEDPSHNLYVTDQGKLTISRRLSQISLPENPGDFLRDLKLELLLQQGECSSCTFFGNCLGYFKIPDRNFGCAEVKKLLGIVREAADELRNDYEKSVSDES